MHRRHFLAGASSLALGSSFLPAVALAAGNPPANALVVGCSAALTGPLAGFGQGILNGVETAFSEVNAAGGINGRPLHYTLLDDGYKAERSVENVKQLLADPKILGLLGCMGTPNNTAITPLIEASDSVHLGPYTGAASLRVPTIKNVYHVRASYNDEVERLVDNLVSMNLRNLAIAYLDNGFGKELLKVSLQALTARGLKAVAQVPVATDGAGIDAAASTILATKPSAILLFTAGAASVGVVSAIRKLSPGTPLAGLSVAFTSAGIVQLGDLAAGIALTMVLPDAQSAKYGIVRKFQHASKAAGNKDYNPGGLEGYVNAQLLIEAFKKAGANPSRSKLRESVAGIRNMDLGGFRVDYSEPSPRVGSAYVNLGILSRSGRFTA